MRDAICLVDVRQDLLATLVIGAADLGQADFARAAVEQPHTEPRLERMNVFGNRARGHAEGATGRGEATGVHDPDEGRHACCAVHQSLQFKVSAIGSSPRIRCEEDGHRATTRFPVGRNMLQLQRNDRFPPHCEGVGASANRGGDKGATRCRRAASLLSHAVYDGGGAAIMAKGRGWHCQATRQCPGQLCRRQRMMNKLGNPGGRQ